METPAVVTPEAVPLDLQPAGLGSRFVALLIDWTVQGLLGFALLLLGIGLSAVDGGVGSTGLGIALFFLLTFVVLFGYPVALETLWRGRTLGKAAMGLRVVTTEGGPVRFRHAAIRAALGLVDFMLTSGAAAVISVLVTRNNQRLGDLVAGTLVLRERTGLPPPQAAAFSVPVGLEDYAASLDVSSMTADDYRALRAFLLRAPTLDHRVRYQLAVGLADPLAERVRPLPPPGIHPAWYLICVAAVYQGRNASRAPAGG
ncbi:MAG TPA: RDD family protein, partial [Acidimicrobiales bacterium]|nr:RDD family protein [Acidimicrobiales bacterium]